MTDLRSTTERVSDTLRTVTIAARERHYPRDCLVLRVSRLRVPPVYVYCPFVIYTCLQSTSPYALPTPLRFTIATSPYESIRVARRLSITSFELPRYTTRTIYVWGCASRESQSMVAKLLQGNFFMRYRCHKLFLLSIE